MYKTNECWSTTMPSLVFFFGEKKREMRDMWDWSFPFRDKFWSSEKVHTNIGSKIKTIWYKAWSLLDNASNSEVGFIIQKRPRDVSLSIAIIMSLFRGNHNIHEKTVQWKQQQKKFGHILNCFS